MARLRPAFAHAPSLRAAFAHAPSLRAAFALAPSLRAAFAHAPSLRAAFAHAPSLRAAFVLAAVVVATVVAATAAAAQPARVVARAGETEVVLNWTPVAGASGYVVRRSDGAQPAAVLAQPASSFWVDRAITPGTAYTYTVRAVVGGTESPDSAPAAGTPRPLTDAEFLDLVEALAFDYFWFEAHPVTGLVKDRSTPGSASSIAAVGFGLTAWGIGAERGWITRAEAAAQTLRVLRTLWTAPQGTQTSGTSGYNGFFYHFLRMDTGLRDGTNELSTIDTALLMAGVLYAGAYYTGPGADETEIRTLATRLYERVDWRWSQAGGSGIRLGWFPESGFLATRWVGYNEAMILYLLAYGSPTFPAVPDWSFWTAGYQFITAYGYQFVGFPPLFGHQYSHAWVDFRGIQDAYMRARGLDYFENSRRATLAQRAYAIANPAGHPGYGPNEWGFTASDDPDGYEVHGAPPADNDNGTIAPTAVGGSVPFAPDETTAALRHLYRRYPNSLWQRYGFRDAFNLRRTWFASDFLGIDQGPFVLMIENHRSGHVWNVMRTVAPLQLGLQRAGFRATATAGEATPEADFALAVSPNPARGPVEVAFLLDAPADVRVRVTDVRGREVAVVAHGPRAAGRHAVRWAPDRLAAGVYAVHLSAGGRTATRRWTHAP